MTREELLRVLDFMGLSRAIMEKRTRLSAIDPRWNIIAYSMQRHLEGKSMTTTTMALAAEVPYGTALRRISELIEEGLIIKRVRSKTGKSYSLHPSRELIKEFESCALQLKALMGKTFGFDMRDGAQEDFYFGGHYMASRILSYPNAMRAGVGSARTLRILSPIDPTFKTLSNFSSNLDELCGARIEIVNLPLDNLHKELMSNAARKISRYDIVAVDLPWIGQLAHEKVIEPLTERIKEHRYSSLDFHPTAWLGSSYLGEQYGLPIQPTAEMLFCRSDLLSEAGLGIPRTTEEVAFAARTLHQSEFGFAGIVMNYGRGTPVAHTFIQTLADFGQPVINLSKIGEDFDLTDIKGDNFRPMIDTPAGRDTAEYLRELLGFAHAESLRCNWDKRISLFAKGHAAMTYGWSIRAAAIELDEFSPAHGKVQYVGHPHAPGKKSVSPIGGFSFAIPTGLPETRQKAAWKVMEYLTRPEMMKWYVQNGNLTSPRFSTSADPEVLARSSVIGEVDAMERRGELKIWPRPPVPEFSDILTVLGVEIHDMLKGTSSKGQALSRAQSRVDKIMRAHGRY
jgi:multiple sugar transport system substrate-binding protein